MDDNFFKIFISIVQDGSNDPKNPSTLSVLRNGVIVLGQVSAGDPDYFYIPIPPGMTLSSLTLTNFSSLDPIAFVALQSGKQFSAGQDLTKMVFGSHFTQQSVRCWPI